MAGRPESRLLILAVAIVIVAGACADDDGMATTTAAGSTTEAAPMAVPPYEPLDGVLTVGVAQEIVPGNIWENYDEGARSTNAAVVWYETLLIDSYWGRSCGYLAATDDPEPVRDGDHWTVTIPLRERFLWSDGEEVTAHDYVFTMEVIEEFDLGRFWLLWHPIMIPDDPGTPEDEEVRWIESVRALDDHTVEIVLSPSENPPDPLVYQHILRGSVHPEHFWRPIVEACRNEDDPKACLHAADATGSPTSNAFRIESWGQGEVILAANPDCFYRGVTETEYANGAIVRSGGRLEEDITCGDPEGSHIVKQATIGPFVERVRVIGYGSEEEALDAFIRGDIDFTPHTVLEFLAEEYRRRILALPDITVVVNPTDTWDGLFFNLRKPPMDDPVFRQALALVIDKEAILADVPGFASASYSIVSPHNPTWYADDVNRWGRGMTDPERLEEAVRVLSGAGYSWTTPPQAVKDGDGEYTGEIVDGEGLIQRDGTPVPELEYLVPPGDTLWQIAGESIPEYAARLGITITWQPTDFATISDRVGFAGPPPDEGLGWDLFSRNIRLFGGQTWPCGDLGWHIEEIGGYTNPEFEALSAALDTAAHLDPTARLDEGRPICAEMQRHIADNLPVIVLWSPTYTEFWRNTIELPETQRLYGLGNAALRYARIRE
jgi:ABC-type transport system substrate-binding protein